MLFKDILSFLTQLKENNNREWFTEHKSTYQKLQGDFTLFVEMLINKISQFDKSVAGLAARKCVFRIYRDVRFSKDKSPYKTNFGGFIVPGGKKSGRAGYYLHIDPEQSFMAGGIYAPPSDVLMQLRKFIMNNIEEFLEITEEETFKNYYGELWGDKLKNPPKGFPADFPYIDILKYKSFTYFRNLSLTELTDENFFQEIIKGFKILSPFHQFLNSSFEK